MVIDMNETKLKTVAQISAFLAGTADVAFATPANEAARRDFISSVLKRFGYSRLAKKTRGVLFAYMQRLTGYSRQHLSRLIAQHNQSHSLDIKSRASRASFVRRYTAADVALLAEMDRLHETLSGPATKVLCQRAATRFDDARYARLADISVSHLYNLRASEPYRKQRLVFTLTRPAQVAIGNRKAPTPNGCPGFIRIDSVHQGDQDGTKGVYHINAVDCVTQWQVVASVERISEAFLLPVLQQMMAQFPFALLGFHSDNGSEYINGRVAALLEKLRIEQTKSRSRHSNDNALVECKNGAVIRKWMGYAHIPQHHAARINAFYADYLNPYLNFHRPCFFAIESINAKGKILKSYPLDQVMTPYDRLTTIAEYATYLKPEVTPAALQAHSNIMTDSTAAYRLQTERKRLFQSFNRRPQSAA